MNIAFIDIDGVIAIKWDTLCPVRLKLLKDICDKGNASVVLSSTWRTLPGPFQRVKDAFKVFSIPFIGATPDLFPDGNRIDEIVFWIEQNKPDNWVVIDDWDLNNFPNATADFNAHFVQTDERLGLERSDAEKAISILLKTDFKFWNAFDEAREGGAKW